MKLRIPKVISVDPIIPFFLAMMFFSFVAGIMIHGSYLTPPPPEPVDVRAEYCRGVADEAEATYNEHRDFLIDQQTRGQIISATPMELVFGELPANYKDIVTEVCTRYTLEEFNARGMRGPSDITTTTVAP